MLPVRSSAYLCPCQIVALQIMAALHMESFIINWRSFIYFSHSTFAQTKVSRTIWDAPGILLVPQLPGLLLAGSPTGPLSYLPVTTWIFRKSLTAQATFVRDTKWCPLCVCVWEHSYHTMIEPWAVIHSPDKHSKKFRIIVEKHIAVSSWWKHLKI